MSDYLLVRRPLYGYIVSMNRTDRLLAIVLELQNHDWLRAEDLAAKFEISKRTVYRDMDALSEMGVPIVSMTGQGYALMEGFFLPPLTFNHEEALVLAMGSQLMRDYFDHEYKQAAVTAQQKITAVLPAQTKNQIEHLQQFITFFTFQHSDDVGQQRKLRLLRQAIFEQRRIRMRYNKRFEHEVSDEVREVDPYGLAHLVTDWYLLGHCHLRNGRRVFRLNRIEEVQLLTSTFEPPIITVHDWVNSSGERPVTVIKARFAPESRQWLDEYRPYYLVAEEETAEGVLVTLHVRYEDEATQWLLGWGAQVEVLEPESLRQKLADIAAEVAAKYRGKG
ncbi:MAG: YafY family transcriptional regulator [Anaerolineales bacterium]|nr:YafY family transcriptional regulator [Anaerolineales bacterium]